MASRQSYCEVYLFVLLLECFIVLHNTTNSTDDIRNRLDSLLNQEALVVRQKLLYKYPNLFQIATRVYNKTLSPNESVCRIVSDDFMDSSCSSDTSPSIQTCIGRIPDGKSNLLRGCYKISSGVSGRHRRDITEFSSTLDAQQRSLENVDITSALITAPIEMSPTASQTLSKRIPATNPPPSTTRPHVSQSQRQASLPPPMLHTQKSSSPKQPATPSPTVPPPPPPTRPLPPPTSLPANFYFLAINIIAKTVSISYEQRCHAMKGMFDRHRLICTIPQTHQPPPQTNPPPSTTIKPPENPKPMPFPRPRKNRLTSTTKQELSPAKEKRIPTTTIYTRNMTSINYRVLSFKIPLWLKAVAIINVTGHSCSIISLFLLICTYFLLKPDFT